MAESSYPTAEVRGRSQEDPCLKGGSEEIPFVQSKEQRLQFDGAAVKRYPTPKVRETQVRW